MAVGLEAMEGDLAIGTRAKRVAESLQICGDAVVIVEFSVGNELQVAGFIGDGLGTGLEIDDAQAGVAEGGAPIWGEPGAMAIGTTMAELVQGMVEPVPVDGFVGNDAEDTAHKLA